MARIKFDILNRWTSAVQFTAEIECAPDALPSIKFGLAVQWAIKARANLADADLAGANLARANLAGANLARAYLADANLARANLADANLAGAYLADANLARADLARANLAGAYLAGANLADAYLADAYLADANLARAYLARANLARAYLARANLARADLARADLADQWIIQGAVRSDGYAFFLQKLKDDKKPMVKAGCRYFTLAQAKAHWIATRGNTPLGRETEIIVMGMVAMAIECGLMERGYTI